MNKTSSLRAIMPLYLVIFFGFVGYSLMITIFTPMLLHGTSGMMAANAPMAHRTIILGVVLGLYPLGQFLGSPVLGPLSDHFGRRNVLIVSLGLTTVLYIFIAWSLVIKSLLLLMIVLFLTGLSEANIVVAQSAIADVTQPHDRSQLFGYIYLSASMAYIIGPLIGGKLADPQLVSWFNYATPFWLVFGLLLIVLLTIILRFRETKQTLATGKINYTKALTNLFNVFTNKRLRSTYLVNFLLYLAIFGFFRCYPMYLVDEFHMQVSQLSEYIAWVAVPIIIANLWLTGRLAKRFSAKQITVVSGILTGIFMSVILIPSSINALWITLFLASLALAICLPACATMLSVSASAQDQGKVMGNNQSLQVCAESLSGVVGGVLAGIIIALPLIVLGIVAVIGAVMLALSKRPS